MQQMAIFMKALEANSISEFGIAFLVRRPQLAALLPDAGFVHHIQRRAELARQLHGITSADLQVALLINALGPK